MLTRSSSPPRFVVLVTALGLMVSACGGSGSWWDIFTGGADGEPAPADDGDTTTTTAPPPPPAPGGDGNGSTTTAPPPPPPPGGGGGGGDVGDGSDQPTDADGHPENWDLVFSDEFNGNSLDRSKWCTRYVYGGGPELQQGYEDPECLRPGGLGTLHTLSGNGEGEIYQDRNTLGQELHVVRDGHLELNATHTAAQSERQWGIEYESSMIRSKTEFLPTNDKPLYMAARVRMPDVQGTWPAWWLNPGFGTNNSPGWPPEIDIIEGPLNNLIGGGEGPDTFFLNLHGGTQGGWVQQNGALFDGANRYTPGTSVRDTWITVGFEWASEQVCWSVAPEGGTQLADVACGNYQWGNANPASILLNLAVGGWGAEHDNSRLDPADFPGIESGNATSFDIDFIRVYQPAG